MACTTCRRCRNFDLIRYSGCKHGYRKTEEQLIREQYNCFDERINYIDTKPYHPDTDFEIYGCEVDYSDKKIHCDMAKSERMLKKT